MFLRFLEIYSSENETCPLRNIEMVPFSRVDVSFLGGLFFSISKVFPQIFRFDDDLWIVSDELDIYVCLGI